MERPLTVLSVVEPTCTCVWADAGVLTYRLCDRGFACEHCPLDAAIRSDPRLVLRNDAADAADSDTAPWSFPADRLYANGHVWVQVINAGHIRAGIDACAARLLPPIERAVISAPTGRLGRGEPLCTLVLEAGEIRVPAPVSGSARAWNHELLRNPASLAAEPYAAGWIAEMSLASPRELRGLRPADAARQEARLAVRHFGRQAAFSLLDLQAPEDSWIDPRLLDATRCAIGPGPYLSMVREALL